MMDQIIWWTGACVLSTCALWGAYAIMAALTWLAIDCAIHSTKKLGNVAINLNNMRAWVRAGKPTWYFEDGKVTQMKPTVIIQKGDAL